MTESQRKSMEWKVWGALGGVGKTIGEIKSLGDTNLSALAHEMNEIEQSITCWKEKLDDYIYSDMGNYLPCNMNDYCDNCPTGIQENCEDEKIFEKDAVEGVHYTTCQCCNDKKGK